MDCCLPCDFFNLIPEERRAQYDHNKKIDKQLKAYTTEFQKEIKLLLLGTGEAGKSTFIRQMHIIYDKGFPPEERKNKITVIHQNIFNSMQNMIRAMQQLQIQYEKIENEEKNCHLILYVDCAKPIFLEDPYLSALKELWNDSGIQECYKRRNEYQLNDSTEYYLKRIDTIAQPDYMPNNQDILRIRVETTGLVEHKFTIKRAIFRMTDVGGQRSERRKWMRCFDNAKSIIFVVAISEYDQVLMELDENRLRESKKVYESIALDEWFTETSIILFLNKTDILEDKIMNSHLDKFFPEFPGPRENVEAARTFILNMFLEIRPEKKKTYHHFTCATDTENIQVVFVAVRDIILSAHLDRFGLV